MIVKYQLINNEQQQQNVVNEKHENIFHQKKKKSISTIGKRSLAISYWLTYIFVLNERSRVPKYINLSI